MALKIDRNLIDLAKSGDAQAFSEIYFILRNPLFSFAYRMLQNFAVAEDISQEVFIFFIQNPEKYDSETGELLPYLCGIARHKIFNFFRKNQLHNQYFQEDADNFSEFIESPTKTPLKLLLDQELKDLLETEVGKLPVLQREVLILRDFQELSYEEISVITETSLNNVKARIFRARRNLAEQLAPYYLEKKEKNYELH